MASMHEPLANWNGTEMPLSEVRVSVLDRGFLFGDAVYETIRVYHGRPFLFDDHLQRLQRSLQKLNIVTDLDRIAERTRSTLTHGRVQNGTIYVQITRGVAPRSHRFPEPAVTPNELITVTETGDPYADVRQSGVKVLLVEDLRWKRCDIKSTNLLPNCLAAEQAHQAGYDEAVFVEDDGTLSEGTHTSLFAVRDRALLTAPLQGNILPGITRKLILKLAEQVGLKVFEEALHRDRLATVDELFLTGTMSEILPVIQVDQQRIGTGSLGPVVKSLQLAYQAFIAKECGRSEV